MERVYFRIAPAVGRTMIALVFLLAGFDKVSHFQDSQDYMIQHGMSQTAFLLSLAIFIELGGGLSRLAGSR